MSIENLKEMKERRTRDTERFAQLDKDECQLCGAHGADKRSLFISCFYAVQEVIPEVIDLADVDNLNDRGYYLRICKSCRARLLAHLRQWRQECVSLRELPKDHDGYVDDDYVVRDPRANISVRKDGAITHMTPEQWEAYRESTD